MFLAATKRSLSLINKVSKHQFKPITNKLRYALIKNMATRNRPKIPRVRWALNLRDQGYSGRVPALKHLTILEKLFDCHNNIISNNTPGSLIELTIESIQTRRLFIRNTPQCILNLFIRKFEIKKFTLPCWEEKIGPF